MSIAEMPGKNGLLAYGRRGRITVNEAFRQLVNDHADFLIIGLYPDEAKARELRLFKQVEPLKCRLFSKRMFIALSK